MIRPLRTQPEPRAPRANLQGIVSATVHLENGRQLSGKLRTLSITGGLLDLATCLDERTYITLIFTFGHGFVQSKAQLLFPMRGGMGYLQPFRFTSLGVKERQTIATEIAALLKQTLAEKLASGRGLRPPQFYLESF
jgi:hypothetical protein